MSTETRTRARLSPGEVLSNTVTHGLLIVFVILAIGPILVVIMNSFKTTKGIFEGPFSFPTPETFNLQGYENVFKRGEFLLNYQNSIIVTVSTTLLVIVLSAMAAWAITEYKVRITPLLAGFFILGIMLPIRLGTVPIARCSPRPSSTRGSGTGCARSSPEVARSAASSSGSGYLP